MNVQVDYISANNMGSGEIARHFLANGRLDPAKMRPWVDPTDGRTYISVFSGGDPRKPENYANLPITNAGTLRREEWMRLDEAVLGIAEYRLNGVADLTSRGLTYNLGNGMASTVLEYHDVGDALTAEMTMDGVTRSQNDRPIYTTNYLPLPIIHADYEMNERVLQVSRNMGNPLDTTLAERAGRRITEHMENMLFTNVKYSYGGGTIYSYLNHPDRIQKTLSTNWDDASDKGATIVADVLAVKQLLINNYQYGDIMIYIPTNYETLMDEDYDVSGASLQTIRERLMRIEKISGIKVVDTLPDDEVVFVTMNSETVRWITGMPMTNVSWGTEGGMIHKFKVMTIQVPQIRSDQNGKMGLVHLA